ncbi:unnamed protein product [Orchesella dallaii]|uniref:ARID domain-containing protein n=1 Tax=Orchesella dallaii TaxID=48710 RepID=A0ABP1PX81_9HEXA
MADDPPYLTVGTEVSAKYKGAFCEAKIRKVVRVVKCKVTFKAGNGSSVIPDDQIRGILKVGANVEAKHPDKNQFMEATLNKIQDSSQYTVVFDDGDITTLRRSALCLKSGRHFNESETLDQLPLTHPEHFSNPVVGGRRGVRRRAPNTDADKDESSEEEDEYTPTKRDGRRKYEKELDMGKVVCVESTDKKKAKDTWFPALVVSPSAQDTVKIRTKDEYLVRSFRDGRYYTVPKKEITAFTKESSSKYDSNSNVLRTAVEKALLFLEKNELPPHWDREVLFANVRLSESGEEEQQSESEFSEDDPREEKDRFIAQLYKFMDDRSTPLNKVPQVCNKDIDLHKLFKTVTGKGGYTKVTNQSQWKAVAVKMGVGTMPSTSTINLVKQAYKKFLFNFEEFYRKLGCTWTPRTATSSSSKSRSSRSLFRERVTPSSSRESVREPKKEEGSDDSSSKKEVKEKSSPEDPKEKIPVIAPSPVADSPVPPDTGTGSESEVKKEVETEPRRSRGRQSKKEVDDAAASASPSTVKTKRQTTASKERDSSVASSKDDGGSAPPTPSSSTTTTPSTKQKGVGRGKYKRNSTKVEVEEKEIKEEKPIAPPVEPPPPKIMDIRLGDKLEVYYPKSEGKTYEAKVIDINEKNESFLVHYNGWNQRYDEWIDRARVSVNITLKMEATGEVDNGKTTNPANPGVTAKGMGKRKGRNSSSATSNSSSTTSSAAVTPTLTSSTASGTRSKVAIAAGKRKRSTSSEIPIISNAPKRRRTRQKSGQDTTSNTAPSESEPETSDSDGKSNKSEKTNVSVTSSAKDEPPTEPEPPATTLTTTTTVLKESKPSLKSVTEVKAENKMDVDDAEDEVSCSSATSAKSSKSKESPTSAPLVSTSKVEEISTKESSSSSSGSGQVIDLNQIRSEMKGLDKMVKSSGGTGTSSPSPAPPPLAAVGGSPPPSEPTKVDIYEFQEDFSDDSSTTAAPKLKMFSPRSPDKGPNMAPVVVLTDVVVQRKEEAQAATDKAEKEKASKPEPSGDAAPKSVIVVSQTEDSKEAAPPTTTTIKTVSSTPVTVTPPKPVTPIVTQSTPATTSISTPSSNISPFQSTPPPPVLSSPATGVVLLTTPSPSLVAPSLVAVTSAPTLPLVTKPKPTATKGGTSPVRMPSPSPIITRTPFQPVTITAAPPPPQPISIPPPPPVHTSITTHSVTPSAPVIVTAAPSATPILASVVTTQSIPVVAPPPPVLIQNVHRPQLQPVLTPVRPIITITSTASLSTPERPLLQPVVTSTPVAATITSVKDTKLMPFMTRKQDLFPHLIQPSSESSSIPSSSIPTISIISAKEASEIQAPTQPPPPPIKIAATIPPPPPVLKTPVKSGPLLTSIGSSESSPVIKPKKKKTKSLGTTPVKTMAPLPTGGAPPPPPIVVSSTTTGATISSTPTPGRKTPVKKRIPPPMESPVKSLKTTGSSSKPGKMNPEAMNAAIANVGASPIVSVSVATPPPPPVAVPTTVITSTTNLFQTHPSAPGVLFATTCAPPVPKPNPTSITIKSSAESIAASIAAVASMGPAPKTGMPTPLPEKKSGMPMKRFMKDSAFDKMYSKDKIFPVTSLPPQVSVSVSKSLQQLPPPPPIVIGKPGETSQSPVSSSQPPPPITIQAKFQPTVSHTLAGTTISGPAVTFMKTPAGHHIMDQAQVQSNLPKHPVIIIPAAPVVIKPAPYQHHQPLHNQSLAQQHIHQPPQSLAQQHQHQQHLHHTSSQISSQQQQHHHAHIAHAQAAMQPVIVSKPMSIEAHPIPHSTPSHHQQQPSVLATTSSTSIMKSTMLPITVTPSIVSSHPVSSHSITVTMQSAMNTMVQELKLPSADLPPTITVTKATTVMKSISPDIVAVSSYSSARSSSGYTPVKQQDLAPIVQAVRFEEKKEPEIIVKQVPPTAQIVFQTEKKIEVVPLPVKPIVSVAQDSLALRVKAEEESCSLLCEEIIPGSPTTGEESEKFEDEMEPRKLSESSERKPEVLKETPMVHTEMGRQMGTGNKPVIVVGPKFEDDEDGFLIELDDRRNKYDEDDDKIDDRSVDSPMGPPSEGRGDLPFRDSFSGSNMDGDGVDHSPPSSPSTSSTISTDDSSRHGSRQHDTSRLSPTPEGVSSKSKDSDDEDLDSDVGSKSTHIDDADSKHGSTRGSTRIRNQSSRLGRSPSPAMKRRRTIRRNKSPEELSRYTQRSRTSSGRKITPSSILKENAEVKAVPPPPLVNLSKPPKTGRYNFIPNLNGVHDSEQRISMISQAIYDLKDKYQKTKVEAASFDRRVKRWKRRVREKERLARQEATRAAS